MALWFPMYVNRDSIAHVEIVRTHTDVVNTYQWQVTDREDARRSAAGTVGHEFGDGAFVLAWKVLGDYMKGASERTT